MWLKFYILITTKSLSNPAVKWIYKLCLVSYSKRLVYGFLSKVHILSTSLPVKLYKKLGQGSLAKNSNTSLAKFHSFFGKDLNSTPKHHMLQTN